MTIGPACGSDDDPPPAAGGTGGGSPEETGKSCDTAAQCFVGLEAGGVKGTVQCLDRVRGGYCTHTCDSDADCCAVPGECVTGIRQVCSPFESTGQKVCFLSCEGADLVAAPDSGTGPVDEWEYCQREASSDFMCRSSGGGSQNRKVCVPGDCGVGAACVGDVDCKAPLTCMTGFKGGYCGVKDCTTNAQCPADSLCVKHSDAVGYCYLKCTAATTCSFCRPPAYAAACSDQVTFLEAGTTGSVCVPPI
jgi:hypothetical protein